MDQDNLDDDLEETRTMDAEESLLYSARHGEVLVVKSMIEAKKEGKLTLDINCKGKSKGNLGWTALHLATYFGHFEVVSTLLEAGVDVDAVNDTGDTALHKACFIGNKDLILLLLVYNADVHIMNGIGSTPLSVCADQSCRRLIEGAEKTERAKIENELLSATREGRIDVIQRLLSSPNPPNINCVDAQGNSALHIAAYRGISHVAVLLLQNGINNAARNNNGQLAIDLAKNAEIREVLSVRPVQRLQRTAARVEGPLMKKSRFLGWRPVWAVLQRGVFRYYSSREDAARDSNKFRSKHYLDGAKLVAPEREPPLLVVHFSDGDTHRLAVTGPDVAVSRQSWITALTEHIAYSGHYLWAGASASPDDAREATETADDDSKPLGSMQDALTAATNNLALLETQLKECTSIVAALDRNASASLHQSAIMRYQHAAGSGQAALVSLRHCAALVTQACDATKSKLEQERERNRVLEEALAALARTHHALEMSVAEELSKSTKRKKKSTSSMHSSKENFYDVCDGSDDDDTLVTAGLSSPLGALSPFGSAIGLDDANFDYDGNTTPTNDDGHHQVSSSDLQSQTISPASSMGTLVSHGGNVYRNARPYYRSLKHSSHSQWSL